jgi:hypothetical protein
MKKQEAEVTKEVVELCFISVWRRDAMPSNGMVLWAELGPL